MLHTIKTSHFSSLPFKDNSVSGTGLQLWAPSHVNYTQYLFVQYKILHIYNCFAQAVIRGMQTH